jgi:hypothetical protein
VPVGLQKVCLLFVIRGNTYVTCLIEMENASKRDLLITVNKQKDQLVRYEGRLRGKLTSEKYLVFILDVT